MFWHIRSDFNELRQKVTSPGGTTSAAIQILQEQHIEQILFNAINAAYLRAKEIEKLSD